MRRSGSARSLGRVSAEMSPPGSTRSCGPRRRHFMLRNSAFSCFRVSSRSRAEMSPPGSTRSCGPRHRHFMLRNNAVSYVTPIRYYSYIFTVPRGDEAPRLRQIRRPRPAGWARAGRRAPPGPFVNVKGCAAAMRTRRTLYIYIYIYIYDWPSY